MTSRPLIVRLRNWVGDVVLSIPALEHLQSHGYQLQLVGKGWASRLLAGHGWSVTRLADGRGDRIAQLRQLAREACLVDPGFDARINAVLGPFSFSSALEARLAGLRPIGHAHEGRSLLLARAVPRRPGVHELVNYWQLACALTGSSAPPPQRIDLKVRSEAQAAARQRLAAAGIGPGFVMLCPFAGGTFEGQDKRWPAFPEFARVAAAALGWPLLLCPGPDEVAEARGEYGHARVLEGVPLDEYAALLQAAALMVSNDTGPGHMAAAVGTPLVSVLGPTDAAQWGPWGPGVDIVQPASGWPTVPDVLAVCQQRLAQTESPSR